MAEWYYSKPGPIAPMALPGQNVAIWSNPIWTAFRVIYHQGYPRSSPLVFDLGAIAASPAQSAVTQLANLELATDPPEAVQLRFYPLDDIEVNMRRGQSDQMFKSQNIVARSSLQTPKLDPCLHTTEFVVLKDQEPWAQATNMDSLALVVSRIAFFGFRFLLEELGITAPTPTEMERKMGGRPITFIASGGA